MNASPCQWCTHSTRGHQPNGCDVVLCGCTLSSNDLGAYVLAVALEELRTYWSA